MAKSLFARMLFVYLLIIFIAFTMLGGIFFETLKSQFLTSYMETMKDNAQIINDWFSEYWVGQTSDEDLQARLMQKAAEENTVIWLVDPVGFVPFNADPQGKSNIDEAYSTSNTFDFLSDTLKGIEVSRISDFNNSFKDTVMTVALPLKVGDTIKGAIVVHKAVKDVEVGINAIYRQVFIPLIFSVAFAAILVFILSRYIVRPIRDISYAAGELSRGNLDWRVKPRTKDEIGELAESFNKMAEELKMQDGLRNTFIANVSHELRTPLASVQGFIQGMLDRAIEESDRDKYLEIVLGETKRMNTLISDLLNLAKIESGKFPIEYSQFDINELIRRCILTFEQRIEEKQLEVNIRLTDDKLFVWADEDRISQVITNLIDNAVKFTPSGGELKVWTHAADNKVFVSIADTGEGIPVEDQPYVFERFFKVDKSHSQSTPGTGIGLSIVKRIISQHGEKITLQSVPGKGTTFTFSLTRTFEGSSQSPQVK
jgi:signal transduction histidine kinase